MGRDDPTGSPGAPPPGDGRRDDQGRVAAVRSGDLRAFESLFREYYGPLKAYALSLVGSPEDAEDLVEDLFVRLWERREDWTLTGTLASYLYGAVRNRAMNHLGRIRRVDRLHAEARAEGLRPAAGSPPRSPEEEMRRARLRAAVEAAIEELPDRAREAFLLHRRHGKTQAEIAEIMGVSRRTVENHVARAVRLLARALRDLT